jgi:hypothetical protein
MEYDKSKILWEGSKKELKEGSEEVMIVGVLLVYCWCIVGVLLELELELDE